MTCEKRISIYISYLLRHHPEEANLNMGKKDGLMLIN